MTRPDEVVSVMGVRMPGRLAEQWGRAISGMYNPRSPDQGEAERAAFYARPTVSTKSPTLPSWRDDTQWRAIGGKRERAVAELAAAQDAIPAAEAGLHAARAALEDAQRALALSDDDARAKALTSKVATARKALGKAEVAVDNAQERKAEAERAIRYIDETEQTIRAEAQERAVQKLQGIYRDGLNELEALLRAASETSELLWYIYQHARNDLTDEHPLVAKKYANAGLTQRDWARTLGVPGQAQNAVNMGGPGSPFAQWLEQLHGSAQREPLPTGGIGSYAASYVVGPK